MFSCNFFSLKLTASLPLKWMVGRFVSGAFWLVSGSVFPLDFPGVTCIFEVFAHVTCKDLQDTAICPDWQVPSAGVEKQKTPGRPKFKWGQERNFAWIYVFSFLTLLNGTF